MIVKNNMYSLNFQLLKQKNNLGFCAGVTNLYSDFDGTYMPVEYSHDAICRDGITPLDKNVFQGYFDRFRTFMQKAMGKQEDPKFRFRITTGRNLPEFNYYMRKIRDKGLSIPLPESVIINNGGDEYFRRRDIGDYFKSDKNRAFREEDFNPEKRVWVKEESKGWVGDKIRTSVKKYLSQHIIDSERQKNISQLNGLIKTKHINEVSNIYNELIQADITKEELQKRIENLARFKIDAAQTQKEKDNIKCFIGKLAEKLHQVKQNKFNIQEVPTTNLFYGKGMTLIERLEIMNPSPKYVAGFRDDGALGLHIALSGGNSQEKESLGATAQQIERDLYNHLTQNGTRIYSEAYKKNGDSRGIAGVELPCIKIFPKMSDGQAIDKLHDSKKQVNKIIKEGLNDLVIVAGDGSNDAKMLNFFNYLDNGIAENFGNLESLRKIYDMPLISIYVDTSAAKGKLENLSGGHSGIVYDKIDSYFNSDGNIRFIHVNPSDPKKPQTLQEAVQLAMREYAKRNPKFRENLSAEMKETIEKMDYKYPIDMNVVETLEKKTGAKLWNPAPKLEITTKIKPEDKSCIEPIKQTTANNTSSAIAGMVEKVEKKSLLSKYKTIGILSGLAITGITTLLILRNKNKETSKEIPYKSIKPIQKNADVFGK